MRPYAETYAERAARLEADGYRDGLLRLPAAYLDADYQAGWRRAWTEFYASRRGELR